MIRIDPNDSNRVPNVSNHGANILRPICPLSLWLYWKPWHSAERIRQNCLENSVSQTEDRIVSVFTSGVTERVTVKEQEVLNIILEDPGCSMSDITVKLSVSKRTVAAHIKSLKEKGVITRVSATKWTLANKRKIVKVVSRCQDTPKLHSKSANRKQSKLMIVSASFILWLASEKRNCKWNCKRDCKLHWKRTLDTRTSFRISRLHLLGNGLQANHGQKIVFDRIKSSWNHKSYPSWFGGTAVAKVNALNRRQNDNSNSHDNQ